MEQPRVDQFAKASVALKIRELVCERLTEKGFHPSILLAEIIPDEAAKIISDTISMKASTLSPDYLDIELIQKIVFGHGETDGGNEGSMVPRRPRPNRDVGAIALHEPAEESIIHAHPSQDPIKV